MSTLSLRRISVLPARPLAVLARVAHWVERRRTRAALARLDPHLLADIGLETNDATREATRPFWLA